MPDLYLTLLGPRQVRLAGQLITRFPTVKVQALLAYLAVEAETTHARDTLMGLFWGDYREDSARQNLRKALQHLRHFLPALYLQTTNHTVQFNPASDHYLDVTDFIQLVGACRQHLHQDILNCATCIERMQAAVALYRGDFLAGFFVADSPAFEEWLLLKREWLRREALDALHLLAASYERQGLYAPAYDYAWRQVELDPVREEAHQQLMRILALSGRRSEALTQYENCRRILAEELAVEPAQATMALVEQIRNGTFSILPAVSPAPVILQEQEDEQARRIAADRSQESLATVNGLASSQLTQAVANSLRADWGEAPDVSRFYGRQAELEQLRQWLVDDHCRLVAVLGMGGIGKTVLATLAATQVENAFTCVIWRSLRNAPPVEELLSQCIQAVASHQVYDLPSRVDKRIALLMKHLQRQRCLLVLDNFETILRGERIGHYLPGYEGYGQLLQQVGNGRHQSCLLLTSREKPKELIPTAGETAPVRALPLTSLTLAASRVLVQDHGLWGSDQDWTALHKRCSGNPLALQIVAETVHELFAGDLAQFLRQEMIQFGSISDLLAQQLDRLSPLEQEVMFWLAVEREPVRPEELDSDFVQPPTQLALLEALHSLRQRSLVERTEIGFTLQNVVLEHLTGSLIDQVYNEIISGQFVLLQRHALLKAQAKSYVRESQRNLILTPIASQLVKQSGKQMTSERLSRLVAALRSNQPRQPGYAGGNLLNLLVHLNGHLLHQDFSQLAVWQADLRNVSAEDVNFQGADLSRSVFTETFSGVLAVAFSPDGEQLAVGTTADEIRSWRVADGQPLLTYLGHTSWVHTLCFSPDGCLLASGSLDQNIRLWETVSGQCLATLQGHTDKIYSVCFSPDGRLLASGSGDQTIRLWDVANGQCLTILKAHSHEVRSICFSSDGLILATGSWDQTIQLWDALSGQPLASLQGHTAAVLSVDFSPNGRILASGSWDQTARLWDVPSGQCLAILRGHSHEVRSVCFSPDGHLLASSSWDHSIRLWDVKTGQNLATLWGHSTEVRAVCFSPDGHLLASGSLDKTIRLWNVQTRQCFAMLQGYRNEVRFIFFPSGNACTSRRLMSVSADGALRLWDVNSRRCLETLRGRINMVNIICFSADGHLLASGNEDHTIHLLDITTEQSLATLHGHVNLVNALSFSLDRRILASGSWDQTIRLWDVQNGQCLATLHGHHDRVTSLCFSPDSRILATGSWDQTVRLWEVSTGQCCAILYGHTNLITSSCFSPDGRLLATGCRDQTIRLWDVARGQSLAVLSGHADRVTALCFSPDGQTLASGSKDQSVRLWDVRSGQCLCNLQGHRLDVLSVCFSLDGHILASGGADETIRLWDVQNREYIGVLRNDGPYARMNITGTTGITIAQIATLKALGAVEESTLPE